MKEPADFNIDLAFSNSDEEKKKQQNAIKEVFGEAAKIVSYDRDMKAQLQYHADYVVEVKGNKFTVDTKANRKPYYSVFIETISKDTKPEEKSWFYSPVNYVIFYWSNGEHSPFLIPINDFTRKEIEKLFEEPIWWVANKGWNTGGYWVKCKDIKNAIEVAKRTQTTLIYWR